MRCIYILLFISGTVRVHAEISVKQLFHVEARTEVKDDIPGELSKTLEDFKKVLCLPGEECEDKKSHQGTTNGPYDYPSRRPCSITQGSTQNPCFMTARPSYSHRTTPRRWYTTDYRPYDSNDTSRGYWSPTPPRTTRRPWYTSSYRPYYSNDTSRGYWSPTPPRTTRRPWYTSSYRPYYSNDTSRGFWSPTPPRTTRRPWYTSSYRPYYSNDTTRRYWHSTTYRPYDGITPRHWNAASVINSTYSTTYKRYLNESSYRPYNYTNESNGTVLTNTTYLSGTPANETWPIDYFDEEELGYRPYNYTNDGNETALTNTTYPSGTPANETWPIDYIDEEELGYRPYNYTNERNETVLTNTTFPSGTPANETWPIDYFEEEELGYRAYNYTNDGNETALTNTTYPSGTPANETWPIWPYNYTNDGNETALTNTTYPSGTPNNETLTIDYFYEEESGNPLYNYTNDGNETVLTNTTYPSGTPINETWTIDYFDEEAMKTPVVDCSDLPASSPSGLYNIVTENGSVEVFCDMDTDGGRWTVIQSHEVFSEIGMNNSWKEYKDGFGIFKKVFWLGNKQISDMTTRRRYSLRIDMIAFPAAGMFAKYEFFQVETEDKNFQLHVGNYSGNAGDGLFYHDGRPFSTYDMDNDYFLKQKHCPQTYGGGWWYKSCFLADLNSYKPMWLAKRLVTTEMKIRPADL